MTMARVTITRILFSVFASIKFVFIDMVHMNMNMNYNVHLQSKVIIVISNVHGLSNQQPILATELNMCNLFSR
jgi:hypothetical protein